MFAVVGATGQTGAAVVAEMSARGETVRAIVRNRPIAEALLPPSAEIVTADLHDSDSIRAALDGVTYLYVGLGRALDLVELEQAVVDAAKSQGVRQYVKCSGVKLDPPNAVIQRVHQQLEDYVRANVPYTIVAPSFFMQNFLGLAGAIRQGVLPMPTGAARAGLIDAADIARAVAAVLGNEPHLGRRYRLTGPESLSHAHAASIFARVLGRPVEFTDVSEAEFIAGCVKAGLTEWVAVVLADVYVNFFATNAADFVTHDVEALTGRAPISLESWVHTNRTLFGG